MTATRGASRFIALDLTMSNALGRAQSFAEKRFGAETDASSVQIGASPIHARIGS